MTTHSTYAQAFATWESEIKPAVVAQYGADDEPAMSESWNDFTDSLCKDGAFTDLQYHHCPAWDDEIPDCDATHILAGMGVVFSALRIKERPDGFMADTTSHWQTLVKRGAVEITVFYSMGAAHVNAPELSDVINCLLTDTSDIEGADFEEWADSLGYDTDSRQAEKIYQACVKQILELRLLFKETEIDQLREIFEDY